MNDAADVELRHLEYVVAVAQEGGFTRAARRLHVVQSAVSTGVRTLERELGATLLDRTGKRVALTSAGEALLPHARAALDAARDARDAVGAVQGGLSGTLRIGILPSTGLVDLPALLGEYHRRHPGVVLRLTTMPSGSAGLVAAVRDGRVDIAFVAVAGRAPAGVRLTLLRAAPLDLVVRRDHPLAVLAEVPLARLDGLDLVDFPVGYGNRSVTDAAFSAAGLGRNVVVEITDVGQGAAYVRHGLGVALLPRYAAPADGDPEIVAVPVTGADLTWPLSIAVQDERDPGAAARALLELAVESG